MKDYIDNFKAIPRESYTKESNLARDAFYEGARQDVALAISKGLMTEMTFEEYMEYGKMARVSELPDDTIRSIRESKLTRMQLAKKHNICISNVSKIRNNRLRAEVI